MSRSTEIGSLNYCFEIWQVHRPQCCRCTYQILERSGDSKYLYRGFETSWDLTIRRFIGSLYWRHNGRDSVSNHQPHNCLLNRLFRRRSKKTSKLRVTGLCVGNSPGTGEFAAQMASNAENVSIWWRNHVLKWPGHGWWRLLMIDSWWWDVRFFFRFQATNKENTKTLCITIFKGWGLGWGWVGVTDWFRIIRDIYFKTWLLMPWFSVSTMLFSSKHF